MEKSLHRFFAGPKLVSPMCYAGTVTLYVHPRFEERRLPVKYGIDIPLSLTNRGERDWDRTRSAKFRLLRSIIADGEFGHP